jgi:tetratricopeptide (TPR) repeat protein
MMRFASACVLLCPVLEVAGALEKLYTVLQAKLDGDQYLQKPTVSVTQRDYEAAKQKYTESLQSTTQVDLEIQLQAIASLNLALCHLKLGEHQDCIDRCDTFLTTYQTWLIPDLVSRAYYFRAIAKLALHPRSSQADTDLRFAFQTIKPDVRMYFRAIEKFRRDFRSNDLESSQEPGIFILES